DQGRCVPVFTLYDEAGARDPVVTENGVVSDFGRALPKLTQGSCFAVLGGRVQTMMGPAKLREVDWLHYLCNAIEGSW
ncbi:hypothetical protein H8J56_27995, partial [Klebsiella sp. Kps]|uniref:hypothetical protein n=1 Tax=Klebsiella sp. Kps TaxID=2758579 RepID=UPI0016490B53